jgi:hypothetical protein
MPKSIEEILGAIQDPESKTLLQQAIADRDSKVARLTSLEQEIANKELVDKNIALAWRNFDANEKPKIEATVAALRKEVAELRPEAERARVLASQIEDGRAVDPKDIVPLVETAVKGKYVPVDQIDQIVQKAVAEATKQVNFGSLPAGLKMLEASDRARREFGLEIPIETFAEATSRYGSVEKAFDGLTSAKAAEKRAAEAKRVDDEHKAAVAAALEEGKRQGRSESETRGYQPEESGMGGISPLVPPAEGENKGVNPMSYDPSAGVVAKEAAKLLQSQEREGLWGKQVM